MKQQTGKDLHRLDNLVTELRNQTRTLIMNSFTNGFLASQEFTQTYLDCKNVLEHLIEMKERDEKAKKTG